MENEIDCKHINNTQEDSGVATAQTLEECLDVLSQDIRDFCLPSTSDVPEIQFMSKDEFLSYNALQFHRDWIAQNRPVIFRGGAKHWAAYKNWQENGYFREQLGSNHVTVSVTPNGYADAALPIKKGNTNDTNIKYQFVMPHEEQMSVDMFLNLLEAAPKKAPKPCDYGKTDDSDIYYIQKQNSNLTDEWANILHDVEEIPWATEAFGKSPDAINFWMGDSRAVTSTHKDPYENMYAVMRGYKDIILYPPSDVSYMPYRKCKQAKFERTTLENDKENIKKQNGRDYSNFSIEEIDEDIIPWIVIDPLNPDFTEYPEFRKTSPFHLRLNAGDILYLPSLWFHHLRQSHGCIAVNFWYDMDYGPLFAHQNFLKNVVDLLAAKKCEKVYVTE